MTEDKYLKIEVERLTKERDEWRDRAASSHENELRAIDGVKDAEKSRDEAIAELNKALETLGQQTKDRDESTARAVRLAIKSENLSHDLSKAFEAVGQLRSDLQRVKEERDRLAEETEFRRAENASDDTTIFELETRIQSAEKERDAFEKEATKQTVRAASAETDLGVQRTRAQSAEASLAKLREAAGDAWSIIHNLVDARGIRGPVTDSLEEKALNVARVLGYLLDEHDKDQKQ